MSNRFIEHLFSSEKRRNSSQCAGHTPVLGTKAHAEGMCHPGPEPWRPEPESKYLNGNGFDCSQNKEYTHPTRYLTLGFLEMSLPSNA
jgi:hypothetical protein